MALLNKKKFSFISFAGQIPDNTFAVVSFTGYEAISKPYNYDLTLISENMEIDPLLVLQNPAKFTIHRDEGGDVDFNGILMQFEETQEFNGYLFFKAVLAPKLWWLSLTHHNQVFLDLTIPEIMESALKDGGLSPGIDFEFRLQEKYEQLEYVCQYDESHLNFVSRWAEREGIYYFFEQTENGEKVVFTDTKISHADLLYNKDLFYHPQSGLDTLHTKEVIKNFICKHNLLPMRVYLKDYNYLKPSLAIEGVADVDENGRGENYIYGEHFSTPEQANRLANIRAEELKCRKSFFIGESSVPFMVPGFTFDLKDHYRSLYNRKYLICDVTHEGHQTGYLISGISVDTVKKEEAMFYANSFTAIYSDEQFRAEYLSEKPKISGTINAKIDAAGSGEHAELDEHGRYKVILPFDRSGKSGGKASAFFRMMQPSAGQNQGMHFPLHKGTEVLLTFIDGNPDRPVIAGAMANSETSSPVKDGNQTQSLISTGKSPVNQSVGAAQAFGINKKGKWRKNQTDNFIEFEDKTDEQRIRLHSEGNLWFEAQDRYAEYRTESAGASFSSGNAPKISGLMANFKSTGPYNPTGMLKRHDPSKAQNSFNADVFKNAHVHVSSMDTVNTQEGNIYDFGGYWNYNLGNCYIEGHLDQKAIINADKDSSSLPAVDDKGYQVDTEDPDHDLLDKGGPGWTKVDWTKADGDELSEDDIKIGKGEYWDTNKSGHPGVLVEKTFANTYAYSKGSSIEVSRGDSLAVQHGGRHVEVGFRNGGSIKSWSWSESGVKKEKKWLSDGTKIYDMDSSSKTGITNETVWNRFTKKKVSQSYKNTESGVTSVHSYCQDTGAELSFSSVHQGANSVHSFDFNWANTAKASFNFAAGAAFSFNASQQGSININLAATQSLDIHGAYNLNIPIKSGVELNFPFYFGGKIEVGSVNSLYLKTLLNASAGIDIETALFKLSVGITLGLKIEIPGCSIESKEPLLLKNNWLNCKTFLGIQMKM